MRLARVFIAALLIVSGLPLSTVFADEQPDMPSTSEVIQTNDDDTLPTPTPSIAPVPNMSPDDSQVPELAPAIITEVQTGGTDEFVELYNPNDEALPLTGLSLWYRGSGATVTQLVDLNGVVLQPKAFAVFGHVAAVTSPVVSFAKASYSLNDTIGEVLLGTSAAAGDVLDKVAWGNVAAADGYLFDGKAASAPPKNNSLQRCFVGDAVAITDPRDTSQEFLVYSNDLPTPFVGVACVLPEPAQPVNMCEGLRINEIAANTTDQFIELRNDSGQSLTLTGCQLQTNRSSTKSYVFGDETVAPGELRTVYIRDTPLTLTKTTTGVVYVLSSDGQTEVDLQTYSNLASDTSWARNDDGTWMQTYAITAGMANSMQEYLPCDEGYVRNVDTGRCNKIVVATTLADCGDGKYRSEETGRCRAIPTASVLAACKLGQYRSEDTNRCRNIVTASVQKPCKDNQYRSEETNRCRNLPVSSVPDAAFAVQPIKDTGTAFVGWWALGGVGLLAAGYGAWEWRTEIRRILQRLIHHS